MFETPHDDDDTLDSNYARRGAKLKRRTDSRDKVEMNGNVSVSFFIHINRDGK